MPWRQRTVLSLALDEIYFRYHPPSPLIQPLFSHNLCHPGGVCGQSAELTHGGAARGGWHGQVPLGSFMVDEGESPLITGPWWPDAPPTLTCQVRLPSTGGDTRSRTTAKYALELDSRFALQPPLGFLTVQVSTPDFYVGGDTVVGVGAQEVCVSLFEDTSAGYMAYVGSTSSSEITRTCNGDMYGGSCLTETAGTEIDDDYKNCDTCAH